MVGAYSTADKVRQALVRVRDKPGFRDHPERWAIVECILDQPDDWAEGFDAKPIRESSVDGDPRRSAPSLVRGA
jgi:hypothetical protein